MSKYLVKYDEWTEVSEQTGTIQNIDDGCPIEVSTTQVEGSGVILYPWEMKPFSNVQLYVRGYNKNPLPTEVRVVPFEVGQGGGGGGGSYVLPTATATRLGGVKIGQGITVSADGTISANGAGISTWAANTPYPLGIYVTYNDDLYLCTTAHTSTATFDSSKWKKIGCDGCKINAWTANTNYDAGDYVTYQNNLYLCVNQHTSGSTFDQTKWKLIGGTGSGIDFWAANTTYVLGDYVTYQDDLYLCTTAHTSGSTFDNSKWKPIGGIGAWKKNTGYVLGDYVTYQDKLYLCTTAHTSSTKFAPTKWKEIGELPIATATTLGGVKIGDGISVSNDGTISWSGIPDWAAATAYSAGEYVTYNDDLYLCTTAHTSTTTFDDSKWKLIGCDGCKIKSWAANTGYDAGDYVTYQNDLYLCTTTHTSGAAFDSTKWKMIGELPIASSSTLGGVKIGQGITVASDGTISSDGGIAEWETAKGYDVGSYVTVYNYGRQEWQDDTAYSAGDFVTNDGNLYKCIVSHTAGSIFADDLAANKWVQVPRDGGLYICVKAHTSNDFHDDFVVDGKWNAIRNGIDFWSTTKHYEVGQYVTVPDHYKYEEWQANTGYAIGDIVTVYNRGKSEWATGTSYAVGDYATMGKALYRCETAHTSSTFANDVAAGDWTLVDTIVEQFSCLDSHTSSGSFATDFGAGKWKSEMPKMETCICLQEHISDDFAANFAAGKWQEIGGIAKVMTGATSSANGASGLVPAPSAGDEGKVLFGDGTWGETGTTIAEWVANTYYSVGDFVTYQNKLYKCTTANSDATWTAANWQEIGGGDSLTDWAANTSYTVGELIVYDGKIYKVTTAYTSGATFDDTNLSEYVAKDMVGATSSSNGAGGLVPMPSAGDDDKVLFGDGTWKSAGAGLPEWQANTSYKAGEYLVHQGTVYKVVNAFTSGTTFSDTDLTPYISPLMKGATSSANGEAGMVIKPTTADVNKFLCGDGTWKSIGGADAIKDILWEGQAYTYQQVLNLTNNYTDYDYIIASIGKTKNDVFYSSFFEPSRGNIIRLIAPLPVIATDFKSGVTLDFSGSTATIIDYLNVGGGTNDIKLVAIVGIKFVNPNVYSTTEQRIGTWIDGKPLYQVTLSGTTNSSGYGAIDFTSYNIDQCVSVDGYIANSNNGFHPLNSVDTTYNYNTKGNLSGDRFFYVVCAGTIFQNRSFYVTLKYTKT